MKKASQVLVAAGLGVSASLFAGGASAAFVLPDTGYVTYGNVNSYSLPILAYQYNIANGRNPNSCNGNPYCVASTPGAIKDLVVIYTGAEGTGVRTNVDGIEGSFEAFSGKGGNDPTKYEDFQKISSLASGDPAFTGTIANPLPGVWDANVASLYTALGGLPVFFFNNNQEKSQQGASADLAIWAKVWVTDVNKDVVGDRYFYLSNVDANGDPLPYIAPAGLGGVPNGDATLFNPGTTPVNPRIDSSTGKTDYVRSGGEVCIGAGGTPPCFSHNLGADQVAYAATIPLLDALLLQIWGGNNAADYTLHIDLRLGCYTDDGVVDGNNRAEEPLAYPSSGYWTDCANKSINNGYEQLFLASREIPPPQIPEPSILALLGLGAAATAVAVRRREKKGLQVA